MSQPVGMFAENEIPAEDSLAERPFAYRLQRYRAPCTVKVSHLVHYTDKSQICLIKCLCF